MGGVYIRIDAAPNRGSGRYPALSPRVNIMEFDHPLYLGVAAFLLTLGPQSRAEEASAAEAHDLRNANFFAA